MKYLGIALVLAVIIVAPYTGAWIEISFGGTRKWYDLVAPYTGAWIEIGIASVISLDLFVAPYTGAWIEIYRQLPF